MALLETTSRWSVFLDQAVDQAFDERGNAAESVFKKYLKKEEIKGTSLITYDWAGVGKHAKTPELNPISYDQYESGTLRTTRPDKYSLGWRVSRELLDDIANGDRVV